MSLTGHSTWRHWGEGLPGIRHTAHAYCYRCPFGLTYPACDLRCARDVEDVIRTSTAGRVAAFLAEPIQGVGGVITPPKEFFGVVVEIVRRYGGLFICDEVQTGFGRTGGHWCGIAHWGVNPDVMTFAKAVANGMPMGVTVARADVADAFTGLTISTFGGNPVSGAAAHATLDVMQEVDAPRRCAVLGARFRDGLEDLAERHPVVGEVRGLGLMQGLELVKDRKTKEPAPAAVNALLEACKREGLLIGKGGLYGNAVRLAPPVIVSERDVDDAVEILDRALAAAEKEMP
jgi:4-aminobutyrate aminotransferase